MIKAEPILRNNLLRLARAYAKARGGLALSTVSRLAHGDVPFFDKLAAREGSFTARKYDDCVKWFDKNRPKGMRWPKLADVPGEKKKANGEPNVGPDPR